jgi:hypothetical protein
MPSIAPNVRQFGKRGNIATGRKSTTGSGQDTSRDTRIGAEGFKDEGQLTKEGWAHRVELLRAVHRDHRYTVFTPVDCKDL